MTAPTDIAALLRSTTEEMANRCSVPMELWGRHSNACLGAADEIERLRAALERLTYAVNGIGPGGGAVTSEEMAEANKLAQAALEGK